MQWLYSWDENAKTIWVCNEFSFHRALGKQIVKYSRRHESTDLLNKTLYHSVTLIEINVQELFWTIYIYTTLKQIIY